MLLCAEGVRPLPHRAARALAAQLAQRHGLSPLAQRTLRRILRDPHGRLPPPTPRSELVASGLAYLAPCPACGRMLLRYRDPAGVEALAEAWAAAEAPPSAPPTRAGTRARCNGFADDPEEG